MPPSTAAVAAAEPALEFTSDSAMMPPITAAAPSTCRVIDWRLASDSASSSSWLYLRQLV
jgi:hypothetical protein